MDLTSWSHALEVETPSYALLNYSISFSGTQRLSCLRVRHSSSYIKSRPQSEATCSQKQEATFPFQFDWLPGHDPKASKYLLCCVASPPPLTSTSCCPHSEATRTLSFIRSS